MNYIQNLIYRSPSKNKEPESQEVALNNALVPLGTSEEEQRRTNVNQEWEKWIIFQAQLYQRHENRLWFLRDQIQDVHATGSKTAMAMDKVLDFIFEDLNPWRRDIANLIVPMAQCLKDANFNPFQVIEAMEKLYKEQGKILAQNNFLKEHIDMLNKEMIALKEQMETLRKATHTMTEKTLLRISKQE